MKELNTQPKRRLGPNKKSKTGCHTCKVRRVKCDEQKPECLRCQKSGRTCDGYGHRVAQNTPSGSLAMWIPSSQRNAKETRGLEYFRRNIVLGLMGFDHNSDFWFYTLLQSSEASPPVLHAIMAFSTLHEGLSHDSCMKASIEGDSSFLQQYNRSIKQLRASQLNQPVQFTLTCCLIFICLENLSGNHQSALAHLQNGLAILQDWRTKDARSATERDVRDKITAVFRRLDMQATVFMDSRVPCINATSVSGNMEQEKSGTTTFSALREAKLSLEKIEIRLFYILTAKSTQKMSPGFLEPGITTKTFLLRGLKPSFTQWKRAFDALCERERNNMQSNDLQLSVLLALHYYTTSIMLELKAYPERIDTDLHFAKINDLCRSLINSTPRGHVFSAETGIIGPLYFTAMNTTNVHIRQHSIDLLRLVKGREGFWDAHTAANISERVWQIRNLNIPDVPITGGIPVLAQAHSVPCL